MIKHKRWYDHDPLLLEVINLLRYYQDDLRDQAAVFLEKIELMIDKKTLDAFYKLACPIKGRRWYDEDPVLFKAIELLRVIPPEVQKKAAQHFLDSLEKQGITPEIMKQQAD